ncbi:MAG: DUF1800 domain-containing protein [Chitinophagales bacterium]|nr:DUF1800 domain-containing protein [Chitinophagales bacterium]
MPDITSYSLAPLNRTFQENDLLHLLRRCLFGIGHQEFSFFNNKPLSNCLDILLIQSPVPPMLAQEDPDLTDPFVPNGQQWVDAPWENNDIDRKRRIYLKGWWTGQIINRDYSLTEKMVIFWHNHFVTETEMVRDARYSYRYAVMLREFALGNFKKLIRTGTTNPAMLVYLNGNTNSKVAPNENYGRELLELFTIGKENKQNYNEDDVKEAARVLTGWKDDKEKIAVNFHPELHDTSDKNFSSFFGNAIIKGKEGMAGAQETDELIELIFGKEQTAQFVCRNLYRWFVSPQLDEKIETEIIAPLGRVFIENNFEIKPVLRVLLGSEHFFDPAFRGCIVKSPVDFFIGASKQFELALPPLPSDTHLCWIHYNFTLGGLGMMVGDPPSVAGWPAFYQAPKYHQWWINTYTLSFRMKIIDNLTTTEGMNCNGPRVKIDLVNFASKFKDPANASALVEDSLNLLCAVEINQAIKDKLKVILNGSETSARQWNEDWSKLNAHPNDINQIKEIECILDAFFKKIISLPEYQMM